MMSVFGGAAQQFRVYRDAIAAQHRLQRHAAYHQIKRSLETVDPMGTRNALRVCEWCGRRRVPEEAVIDQDCLGCGAPR